MPKKGEANAGQQRKSRNPKISPERLKKHKGNVEHRNLLQLAYRLEQFEQLRNEGTLNTPFIALEALSSFAVAAELEHDADQLRTTWPKAWGNESVEVPMVLIRALAIVWGIYREAPAGVSLGEVFQIEGSKNQGSHPMKSILATADKHRGYAREVMGLYLSWEGNDQAIRLNDAIGQVAVSRGVSEETIRKAYLKHRDSIIAALREVEILSR